MTLPFYEEIINDGEINQANFKYPNFVGYLNPYGIPISFRDEFGYTDHGEVPSLQERFRVYYTLKIKEHAGISPVEKYRMSDKYLISEKERYINSLRNNLTSVKDDLVIYKNNRLSEMKKDVYEFLLRCYSADTFLKGVGNITFCMCEQEFYEKEYKNKNRYPITHHDFAIAYGIYKDKILVDIFKEVLIQYCGYHYVARVPRMIFTSEFRIYETFYNYLLNNFKIIQLPKMIFDSIKKTHLPIFPNEFFVAESEARLKEEIVTLKREIPKEELYKYYR